MIDRKRWLEGAKEPQTRELMARLYDLLTRCITQDRVVYSFFLDAVTQDLCEARLTYGKVPVKWLIVGGHEGSEAGVIGFYPDFMTPDPLDAPIVLLKIEAQEKEVSWSHRDVLGSLLGLGISRDKLGDLRISGSAAYVFVMEELSGFIESSLSRVSKYEVQISRVSAELFPQEASGGKSLFRTVASARLDAIVATGFDLSRRQAQQLVESDRVKVNHRPENRVDRQVPEGAVISVRGYGRLVLEVNLGQSKKDRTKMRLKRFD
jgi:RNA-binding protein YlmH